MDRIFGLRCAAFAAASVVALAARGETAPTARAVIRGTGNDVTIVYRAPRTVEIPVAPAEADPLAEALRRKEAGADDIAVIRFLRGFQNDAPDVIDGDLVRQFRRAGAGEPLVSFLSSYAAVDIGETGEGGVVATPSYAPSGGFGDPYENLVGMGYPFYGAGYGGYAGGWFGNGFGRHPGHHARPMNRIAHFGHTGGMKPGMPHARGGRGGSRVGRPEH
jgi:hypothetical protein